MAYGPQPMTAPAAAIILNVGDNISAIVNAAPAGATFFFEPGVYRDVSLTPKDGQTFIGAQGAILNGADVLTDWSQSGSYWVVGGQTQQGLARATDFALPGAQRAGYPDTVFMDGKTLTPVNSLSKLTTGHFYFDYNADKIYIADNPLGHQIEAGKYDFAFTQGDYGVKNVTIQNLVIEHYDPPIQYGAIQAGIGWNMINNEVRDNYALGISVENAGNNKIIGNYVHDNGEMGMGGTGPNILVQGNDIAHNGGWSGIDPGFEGGGFKFGDTNGLVVKDNYSHDNIGPGMWTDTNNINTTYQNNVVVNNTMGGIFHEQSYAAIITGNVIENNGAGMPELALTDSQGSDIYNNKIDSTNSGYGLMLWEDVRAGNPGSFGPYQTINNHIHDNIFVDQNQGGVIGGSTGYDQNGVPAASNTWDNNQFYMTDNSHRFQWGSYYNEAGFDSHSTGSGDAISQSYPATSSWLSSSGLLTTDPTPIPDTSGTTDTGTTRGGGSTGTGTTMGDPQTGTSGSTGTGTTTGGSTGTETTTGGSSTGTGTTTGDPQTGTSGTGTTTSGSTGTGTTTGDPHTGTSGSTGTGTTTGDPHTGTSGSTGTGTTTGDPHTGTSGSTGTGTTTGGSTGTGTTTGGSTGTGTTTGDPHTGTSGSTGTGTTSTGQGHYGGIPHHNVIHGGSAAIWNAIYAASTDQMGAHSALADLKQQVHDAFGHGATASHTVDDLASWLHLTHHE